MIEPKNCFTGITRFIKSVFIGFVRVIPALFFGIGSYLGIFFSWQEMSFFVFLCWYHLKEAREIKGFDTNDMNDRTSLVVFTH